MEYSRLKAQLDAVRSQSASRSDRTFHCRYELAASLSSKSSEFERSWAKSALLARILKFRIVLWTTRIALQHLIEQAVGRTKYHQHSLPSVRHV